MEIRSSLQLLQNMEIIFHINDFAVCNYYYPACIIHTHTNTNEINCNTTFSSLTFHDFIFKIICVFVITVGFEK